MTGPCNLLQVTVGVQLEAFEDYCGSSPSGFLFIAADAAEQLKPADEFHSLPRLLLHQRSRTVLRHLVLWC